MKVFALKKKNDIFECHAKNEGCIKAAAETNPQVLSSSDCGIKYSKRRQAPSQELSPHNFRSFIN